jgi:hypothetical protein
VQAFRDALHADGVLVDAPPGDTSDGYAIALFGIQAIGINEDDTAQQWLCMARTQIGGFTKINTDPAMRTAQILWALHVMSAPPQPMRRDHLSSACQIVLALSSDQTLIDRARDCERVHQLQSKTETRTA